jgi:hypothetical protein
VAAQLVASQEGLSSMQLARLARNVRNAKHFRNCILLLLSKEFSVNISEILLYCSKLFLMCKRTLRII